jgi:hypothetical protein
MLLAAAYSAVVPEVLVMALVKVLAAALPMVLVMVLTAVFSAALPTVLVNGTNSGIFGGTSNGTC